MKSENKKAFLVGEVIFWLIVAILVLVVVVFSIYILSGKGTGAIDYIKDILFGG
ncbi:hypothetical protein J4456_04945 [Candidatus Pacearchaeota archaeon]|nr:hypothetical protein [Candidatus Pacearchaeota archaeon]